MSSGGAAPRAAIPVSSARAEVSRRNGARSRGPKTPEGKARSARNALKHGMRAQKYVVLPEEDAAEFQALEAALNDELAPDGVLQNILVQRIARAAWPLERAERLEVEVLEFRGYGGARPGLALIRDGNGTRSVETLLRRRGAATAELMRALRTLKALQAEQATVPARAAAAEPARAEGRPRRGHLPRARPERGPRRRAREEPDPRAAPESDRTRGLRPGRRSRAGAAPPPGADTSRQDRRAPERTNPSRCPPARPGTATRSQTNRGWRSAKRRPGRERD